MLSRRNSDFRTVAVQPAHPLAGGHTSSFTGPAKTVRFAPTSENGSSRPLTTVEAWSLYNFEIHARSCPTCYGAKFGHLCATGDALSRDIACHVFARDSEVYAVPKDTSRLVRVEIPRNYTKLRHFLHSTERDSHRLSMPVMTARHTHAPLLSSTHRSRQPDPIVPIDPASTTPSHRRQRRTHGYSAVVAHHDDEEEEEEDVVVVLEDGTVGPVPVTSTERRGTLYEREAQRRRDRVRVEVREPDVQSPERRHRQRSGWR